MTKPSPQSSNSALSRAILAFAAQRDLEVHQRGTKAARLNASMPNSKRKSTWRLLQASTFQKVWFYLKKAVYGTKQGGHVWYEDIRSTLTEMGYTRIEAGDEISIVVLYVRG